jgi:hypothetical protein
MNHVNQQNKQEAEEKSDLLICHTDERTVDIIINLLKTGSKQRSTEIFYF